MTDRPAIFSRPMVRALLDGRKTQTRRLLSTTNVEFGSIGRGKLTKLYWSAHCDWLRAWKDGTRQSGYLHVPSHTYFTKEPGKFDDGTSCAVCDEWGWDGTAHRLWPLEQAGDRLYVREAYAESDDGPVYMADHPGDPSGLGWRPSIHCPRAATRITLTLDGVWIERLQEISDADAIAEGATQRDTGINQWRQPNDSWSMNWPAIEPERGWKDVALSTPRLAFGSLWNELHGNGAWDANPWVLARSFTVQPRNIDALTSGSAAA